MSRELLRVVLFNPSHWTAEEIATARTCLASIISRLDTAVAAERESDDPTRRIVITAHSNLFTARIAVAPFFSRDPYDPHE